MATTEKKIGIIGVGNLLLSDEGFGVQALEYLEKNYDFPENIILMDAGTAAIYMTPFLEDCDPVLVIDVVDLAAEPGSFHLFTLEDVKAGSFPTKMSPHQLGLLEMIEICKLRDNAPEHVEFYCVVPRSLDTGTDLSPDIARLVPEIANKIIARLDDFGVRVTPRNQGKN